jgi:hypothetical protein
MVFTDAGWNFMRVVTTSSIGFQKTRFVPIPSLFGVAFSRIRDEIE